MNRAMVSILACSRTTGEVDAVFITQTGEGDAPDTEFCVTRDEAPDVIRMIAEAFDIDLERVA